jgi:hypothetical protein
LLLPARCRLFYALKRASDQKTAKKIWWLKTSLKMTFKNPAKSLIFSRRIIPARIQSFRSARDVLFAGISVVFGYQF